MFVVDSLKISTLAIRFMDTNKHMRSTFFLLSLIAVILFSSTSLFAQFYNGTQADFGKNRIQYAPYLWQFFRFEKFDTYFYLGGKEIAIYTAESATRNIKDLEEILGTELEDNIQFVIYNKQSDYKQSNIGLVNDELYNIGGATRIVGSKVFIYYEGDHRKLEKQIRAGVAEVLIDQYMYGGSWKDKVKSSTLLNLPDWYIKGLISYLAEEWNTEVENRVKDGILNGKYANFNRLSGLDAVYAGHSLWRYIAQMLGIANFENILYLTKSSRNIESGFIYALNSSLKTLTKEWQEYYRTQFSRGEKFTTVPPEALLRINTKKTRVYSQFKTSPNGKFATYTTNEMGQYKLFLYNFETKKTKRLFKRDKKLGRINDYSYPIVAWHPSSELFAYVTEEKGEVIMNYYNLKEKKRNKRPPLFDFEKIIDLSYSDDGKKMVFSGVQSGQTDIFVFTVGSSQVERITKDPFDDFNPRFMTKSRNIIFASNRVTDTIRFGETVRGQVYKKSNDIFMYNYISKSPVLTRLTNTPNSNETMPAPYDTSHVSYLSDNNGIVNCYVAKYDSALSFVDTAEHYRYFSTSVQATNYSRNIVEQDINMMANKFSEIIFYKGKYRFNWGELKPAAALGVITPKANEKNTKRIGVGTSLNNNAPIVPTIKIPEENNLSNNPNTIDINEYRFTGEGAIKDSAVKKAPSTTNELKRNTSLEFKNTLNVANGAGSTEGFTLPKQRNYLRNFSPDQFVTQVDNTFLNVGYQKYTGGAVYFNPGFNGLMKIGISDVFEDYRIVGGIRLSADLKSNEFSLGYDNRGKRLDKLLTFQHQSFPINRTGSAPKVLTHQLKYAVKWPFNEVASIRGSIATRADRNTFLSTDINSLKEPTLYEYWGTAKLEYVYDNTISKGLNIYNGTRYKLFAEYYNQVNKQKSYIYVLGLDFRHYQKIHRNLIWANRLAASTTSGTQKLVYYLGGVDNWINLSTKTPTFNNNIPVDNTQNYSYQALATNMRGFSQNVRNGNNFAVINSELRWPIFNYLFNRPMRSDFLNSFQVVGFGDVGSAWNGPNPFSEDNTYNLETIQQNPVTVILKGNREPVVAGYGWGMRSRLFGYYFRADWSHGFADGEKQPRIFYLSLSLDF